MATVGKAGEQEDAEFDRLAPSACEWLAPKRSGQYKKRCRSEARVCDMRPALNNVVKLGVTPPEPLSRELGRTQSCTQT